VNALQTSRIILACFATNLITSAPILWDVLGDERSDRLSGAVRYLETGKVSDMSSDPLHNDVQQIRALIDRWAEAVRREDLAAIRDDHDANILMFDVPPPFQSRGIDAYMATWQLFFANVEKPVTFNFDDIEVTAGAEVAFATAKGRCVDIDRAGKREPLEFRLTIGLKKINAKWRVMHEHHSLPALD
jgi:ketosteroid isomerase-like protein